MIIESVSPPLPPPGGEGLRPQVSVPRGSEDGQKREAFPPAGGGGDPDPGAPEEAGQGLQHERDPHAGELHLQEPHLHDLRAAQHEPVRAHQEEQVPGLQPPAGQEVRPLHPAVSGRAAQEPHHPLRPEAGEHPVEAAGPQRHQGGRNSRHWGGGVCATKSVCLLNVLFCLSAGHRFWIELLRAPEGLHLHPVPVLQSARGHSG